MRIGLLTGGSDKPYVLGLVAALLQRGYSIDLVGSDELICDELCDSDRVHFLNYRGDTSPLAGPWKKLARIAHYYVRLLAYASRRQPRVFHVLWANRFFFLDRVLCNSYYKLMGKRLVFTAHNVNERKRDGRDSLYNRLTLRAMYTLVDHIFVHTASMQLQLTEEFGIHSRKISVIPFGINNTLPNTDLQTAVARRRLAIAETEKVLLFFGRIAPYKGLDYAVEALAGLRERGYEARLVVAGRVEEGCDDYWRGLQARIAALGLQQQVCTVIDFIPDEDVETYFKAADVLVLPYRAIFQSGVLFLAYSFGLPVIASNIGSFEQDIVEGETGMIFQVDDVADLVATCARYFDSELFRHLPRTREQIKAFGNRHYSWDEVARISTAVYARQPALPGADSARENSAGYEREMCGANHSAEPSQREK